MCPERGQAYVQDLAFVPEVPTVGTDAALTEAMMRLDRLDFSVVFHVPSRTWILHSPTPQRPGAIAQKLEVVTRHSRVRFRDLMPLDRFHGEVMGVFNLGGASPAGLGESGRGPVAAAADGWGGEEEGGAGEAGKAEEGAAAAAWQNVLDSAGEPAGDACALLRPFEAQALFGQQLDTLNAAIDERASQLVLRGYEGWNGVELLELPTVSLAAREHFAQQLAQPAPASEWLILRGPVTKLTFYAKKSMATARQLAWTLFRMQRSGLSPEPEVAHFVDFLKHYLTIADERRRDNACAAAKQLWERWTGKPFPVLPPEVAARVSELRSSGREAVQCVVCLLPVRGGGGEGAGAAAGRAAASPCCAGCERFACLTHSCAKELLPQERCPDGVPGEVHLMRGLLANIAKLQGFSESHSMCRDYPVERNRLAGRARTEMIRDGCCQGGMCKAHSDVHRMLGAIDEQHRAFRRGGVRWETVDAELERLFAMLRPIRRFGKYSCPRCEDSGAPVRLLASAKADAVAAWIHSPPPADGSQKRSFSDFVTHGGQDADDRSAKWARLSDSERAARWNPVPGAFMLVPCRLDE